MGRCQQLAECCWWWWLGTNLINRDGDSDDVRVEPTNDILQGNDIWTQGGKLMGVAAPHHSSAVDKRRELTIERLWNITEVMIMYMRVKWWFHISWQCAWRKWQWTSVIWQKRKKEYRPHTGLERVVQRELDGDGEHGDDQVPRRNGRCSTGGLSCWLVFWHW